MAQELADYLRKKHGLPNQLTDEHIDRLLEAEKLKIVDNHPFPEDVVEVTFEGHLFLRRGLLRYWRRWLKIHGLVHHLLHEGNHFYQSGVSSLMMCKQERSAELVTGWLFFGPVVTYDVFRQPPFFEIAEYAEVPVECVKRWYSIAGGDLLATLLFQKQRMKDPLEDRDGDDEEEA